MGTMRISTIAAGILLCAGSVYAGDWQSLFNGKNLDGWEVRSGFAKYEVVDGAIVGTSVEKSPNTFLCSKREYGDFELEFEVLCDRGLNSGVQFRSQASDEEVVFWFWDQRKGAVAMRKLPPGRVYGYQTEVPSGKSASCGRIYDEARRAYFIGEELNTSEDVYKPEAWNKYRILCDGQSIKVWVNDVLCTDFKDAMTAKGFIGLQVHGIRENFRPLQSRWRNIRLRELD